jgi:hypothetical protein
MDAGIVPASMVELIVAVTPVAAVGEAINRRRRVYATGGDSAGTFDDSAGVASCAPRSFLRVVQSKGVQVAFTPTEVGFTQH